MSITKLYDGSYLVSMIIDGVLISKKYIGYSRREAMKRFMNDVR